MNWHDPIMLLLILFIAVSLISIGVNIQNILKRKKERHHGKFK